MAIADYLNRGQGNAVPLRQLVAITGLDNRSVRKQIAEERKSGTPILSDNASGYYLPGNDMERAQFVRSMRSRAREILKAASAVEKGDKK